MRSEASYSFSSESRDSDIFSNFCFNHLTSIDDNEGGVGSVGTSSSTSLSDSLAERSVFFSSTMSSIDTSSTSTTVDSVNASLDGPLFPPRLPSPACPRIHNKAFVANNVVDDDTFLKRFTIRKRLPTLSELSYSSESRSNVSSSSSFSISRTASTNAFEYSASFTAPSLLSALTSFGTFSFPPLSVGNDCPLPFRLPFFLLRLPPKTNVRLTTVNITIESTATAVAGPPPPDMMLCQFISFRVDGNVDN
mmetsp:Transcript_10779/g.16422  ORF Transcript_10779/g.16422 Transcript_10779/m.16422 type:complete len:250 (-) Transcript_10779:6-755(-)